jgi:Cu/Ag efflux protein CusF
VSLPVRAAHMKQALCRAAIGGAFLCLVAAAQAADHDHHGAVATPAVAMAEGVVKKVDKAGGKLTLAHGPIDNLGMSAMTMVFKLKAPVSAENLKVGDKVRFLADYVGGEVVIVRLESAK